MNIFWRVFKVSLQDILEYRFDFFMHMAKYVFAVVLMALVWLAVQQQHPVEGLTPDSTIRYFLLAAIFYDLSNFHTWYIELDIKLGQLSKFLTKPLSIFSYYFSYQTAIITTDVLIKSAVMLVLMSQLTGLLTISWQQGVLTALFIPLIYFYTFSTQFLMASLAFWVQEVQSLRWFTLSTTRFLSGIIVPLQLMPAWFLQISFWLPFQHLVYTPIQLLEGNMTVATALHGWIILLMWTVLFKLIQQRVWYKGVHGYEATGI